MKFKLTACLMAACCLMTGCSEHTTLPSKSDNLTRGTEDNMSWEFDHDSGTLYVKVDCEMNSYWDIGGYPYPWYDFREEITAVVLEDGVTTIGGEAFYQCTSLTDVTIPDSVTYIEREAFSECTSLESVTIPESVVQIEKDAFADTPWLQNQLSESPFVTVGTIVIASDPETCVGEIEIPDGVTAIGGEAFIFCNDLTSVKIPESVKYIGSNAFRFTPWQEAEVANGTFFIVNDILVRVNPEFAVGEVIVPEHIRSIGYGAFEECNEMMSVVIPEGVEYIDDLAFSWCDELTAITFPSTLTYIGSLAFWDSTSLKTVVLPEKLEILKSSTFEDCEGLESVTIQENLKEIGDFAFDGCTNLRSITIPQNVEKIGKAFGGCDHLSSVTIENPECEIYDDPSTVFNVKSGDEEYTFTGIIYGYENSTAQKYAEKYGYYFEFLQEDE